MQSSVRHAKYTSPILGCLELLCPLTRHICLPIKMQMNESTLVDVHVYLIICQLLFQVPIHGWEWLRSRATLARHHADA